MVATLHEEFGITIDVRDYSEHALTGGSDARAAAYVECVTPAGRVVWGVGIDEDVATASVRAILSAANAAREIIWWGGQTQLPAPFLRASHAL